MSIKETVNFDKQSEGNKILLVELYGNYSDNNHRVLQLFSVSVLNS